MKDGDASVVIKRAIGLLMRGRVVLRSFLLKLAFILDDENKPIHLLNLIEVLFIEERE